jgi:hypothetical protein
MYLDNELPAPGGSDRWLNFFTGLLVVGAAMSIAFLLASYLMAG